MSLRPRLVTFALTTILSFSASSSAAPPEGYRELQDIVLVGEELLGHWAGTGMGLEMVTETAEDGNPVAPMDDAEAYEGMPSMRIETSGDVNGWWTTVLAGPGWETWDHRPYAESGVLHFNVKGAAGGEVFKLGFADRVFERSPEEDGGEYLSSDFVDVTTEWQHVEIPVSALTKEGLNLAQMFQIKLTGDGTTGTLWLNNIRVVSAGEEPGWPVLKVNQLGYTTGGQKYGFVSGFVEELGLSDATPFALKQEGAVVYDGTLSLHADYDEGSGDQIFLADFSEFSDPGTYVLSVEGFEDSPPFLIDDAIYGGLVVDTLRYFYYQRQGVELLPQHAGAWPRPLGHPQDVSIPFESGEQPEKDVDHGWYDAGDYGKYTAPGATAVSDLLAAYEVASGVLVDGTSNIPESGNGVPDILDEARWELDWLLKMQDASGGFWHRVRAGTDEKMMPHETVDEPRFIRDVAEDGTTNARPTPASGSATAALAEAAVVFRDIDPAFSETLLVAAKKGWEYLAAHPDFVAGPKGHYYNDGVDGDNRLWAAGALFRATGEATYGDYFVAHHADFQDAWTGPKASGYYVHQEHEGQGMELIGFIDYLKGESPDPAVVTYAETQFAAWRETMLERSENGAYRNLLWGEYFWGSNMPVMTPVRVLAELSEVLGEGISETEIDVARSSLNYLLGANALSQSFVTGYGARTTEALFSNIYSWDDLPGMPAGYVGGGPNNQQNPYLSNFGAKSYRGSDTRWTTSEHTIYWNSPVVYAAALVHASATGALEAGDSNGDDGEIAGGDGGCGCRTTPHPAGGGFAAGALLLGLALLRRRRFASDL